MKKTLLLLLFTSIVFSQSKVNINNFIQYGDRWFKENDDKPFSGSVFAMYENGQKKLNGRYQNGIKNGEWTHWRENGKYWGNRTYEDGEQINEYWY